MKIIDYNDAKQKLYINCVLFKDTYTLVYNNIDEGCIFDSLLLNKNVFSELQIIKGTFDKYLEHYNRVPSPYLDNYIYNKFQIYEYDEICHIIACEILKRSKIYEMKKFDFSISSNLLFCMKDDVYKMESILNSSKELRRMHLKHIIQSQKSHLFHYFKH